MFDTIATICDLTIATVGLFFVILEVLRAKKEKKKERIEREMCYGLVQQAKKTIDYITLISKAMNKINEDLVGLNADANNYLAMGDIIDVSGNELSSIVSQGDELINDITLLYKNLIKNESMFSLSIGFERVIDSCRPIIYEFPILLEEVKQQTGTLSLMGNEFSGAQYLDISDKDSGSMQAFLTGKTNNLKSAMKTLSKAKDMLNKAYIMIMELEIKFE